VVATDRVDEHKPGRHASWLAALALAAVLGVALLPRAFTSDDSSEVVRVTPDFLERYNPEAGLAAICREPEILGEAHGLCGLGGVRRTSHRLPAPMPPLTKDIRFATEEPEPTHIETPALDQWDIGFSQLPAVLLGDGGSGTISIAGGGGGIPGFFVIDDDNGNGNPRSVPPPSCDPQSDPECDDDDTEPPPETPPVPEPTAALLFGLGFAAILRRPVIRK
jgi:hypothetical protein